MNIHVFGNEFSFYLKGDRLVISNNSLGKVYFPFNQQMPKTPEHAISLIEDFSEDLF